MWAIITKPFAWLMVKLYELTGNYGVAVILFALVVNLILSPFMAKSKKSMMRQTRIQPQLQELQRRHEGNPQKLNQEMQKLYREEGIHPMSGCLWSLIPFPILIALYAVIRQPITRMMFAAESVVTTLQDYFVSAGLYTIPAKADAYAEIKLANLAHQHWDEIQTALAGKIDGLMNIDFSFLGLNLGDQPKWNFFFNTDWSDTSVWLPALGLFLIPIISAFLSWASMKISNAINPTPSAGAAGDQAAATMKSMNIVMPLMSIWICFVMPAAMGIYWIAGAVVRSIQQLIVNKQIDKMDLDEIMKKNIEKANKKREKQGLPPQKITNTAKLNTRAIEKPAKPELTQEEKDQKIQNATEYYKSTTKAKPGSLASKAQMVQQYNDKHAKKK